MQQQHPQGLQVGGGIQYGAHGAYHGRVWDNNQRLLVLFTILFMLVGFILTMVGTSLSGNFWSESSSVFRIVGPVLIGFGFLLLRFTVYYFKKKRAEELMTASSAVDPASTALTYNQAGQSVNVSYPGTGQIQPSAPQPTYPATQSTQPYPTAPQQYTEGSQPYPTAPQPYPTGYQPYPTAPQSYPGTPQYPPYQSGAHYPSTQQPYPGTAQNQDNMPPPPSYNDVVQRADISYKPL